MATSEKIAELAVRLRNLADGISTDGNGDPREESRIALREAAVELERGVVKTHLRDDSHVIVLVDAHSHPFNNDIFYRSTDRNYPALDRDQSFNIKKRLHEAIRKHLIEVSSAAILGTSRVVVRVYANSTKLENDLLCPLQQFTVQFSSVDPYFDFFSVRDEAMVELKVTDAFQTARKDPNCKHIFLVAWRRPIYLAMLQTPSRKVTLVQGNGTGVGARLVNLPCHSISIPEVFSMPTEQDSFLSLTSHSIGKHIIAMMVIDKEFYKNGICTFSHATASFDDMIKPSTWKSTVDTRRQPGSLPPLRNADPGHVPVNKHGQRLDYYTQRPSPAYRQTYFDRFGKGIQPCRWFHLVNACHWQGDCSFDHSEISTQIRKVIGHMVGRIPCTMGSDCRRINCIFGHICQNTNCLTDDMESCSMRRFHGVNSEFASWAKGKHASESPTGGAVQAPTEYAEVKQAESFWF